MTMMMNPFTALMRTCLSFYLILSIGIGPTAIILIATAKVACNETSTCEATLRAGSTCSADGYCTNPFVKGCLNRMLGDKKYPKIRTCNSEDKGTDAEALGLCAPSPLNYEEVRILPNNWESAMFYAWVIQILLSEVLDVPSTIETHVGGGELSFYDEQNGFAYPKKANAFDALYKANEVGDCTKTDEPCAHFITEMWQGKRELNESAVEREGNGMVGHVGWFIPKFAAEADASLTHYLGLTGDGNRQKLADTFKRPIRWIDYCSQVSQDNCTTSTDVASRAPADATEAESYFKSDLYTGSFIATEKNDCEANPNCTGHIIDYPCTWSAYTAAQLYWNNIPLESDTPDGTNSYTYSAMLQIMDASNATRSPILIVWWYPDPTMDIYDYVHLSLPPTSRDCLENRAEAKPNRCGAPREVLLGKEVGSCGYNTHTLEKYFSRSFRERSVEIPLAERSPAHQLVRNVQLSDIDLSEMMIDWATRGIDKWNYDPRESVCTWVANNFDDGMNLKYFLPPGYPRQIEDEAGYNSGLTKFSIAFGVIGSLVSVAVGGATYHLREEKPIKFAQEFFLYLFSLGFFFVSLGGSLYGTIPTPGTCASRWWLVVIGITFVFVPLLIKIAAINKLMNDARKMRRTNVSKQLVYKIVAALVLLVVVFLSIWTGVDGPVPEEKLVLRSESESIVEVHIQCASNNMAWEVIAFSWEGILICSAAAVAFLSRRIRQAFNESRVVGNVAYTSFFFLVFRLLFFFIPESVIQPSLKNAVTGILLTLESLVVMGLYFGTKFLAIYRHQDDNERGQTSISTVLFNSVGNEEICPVCNRKMPAEPKDNPIRNTSDRVTNTKQNNSENTATYTQLESEIKLESTYDIEIAAAPGRASDLTDTGVGRVSQLSVETGVTGSSDITQVARGGRCVSFQDKSSSADSPILGGSKVVGASTADVVDTLVEPSEVVSGDSNTSAVENLLGTHKNHDSIKVNSSGATADELPIADKEDDTIQEALGETGNNTEVGVSYIATSSAAVQPENKFDGIEELQTGDTELTKVENRDSNKEDSNGATAIELPIPNKEDDAIQEASAVKDDRSESEFDQFMDYMSDKNIKSEQ